MKPNNVYRYIRLKLKTGYMKSEPDEYRFLMRYPPLNRDSAPAVMNIEKKDIPYLKLYNDIIANDPIMRNETVYPVYWQQEPIALTIAKKQYELIQSGLSVEEALQKAKLYANDMESKAYEDLISLRKALADKAAHDSFASKPEIMDEILKWKDVLKETRYEDLALADQGEIDYFIHTKILKWKEVERERRMKDPVIVFQFEKLRERVFPEIRAFNLASQEDTKAKYKELFSHTHNVDFTAIKTTSPFYYEDYAILFNRLRERPHLVRWNDRPRESLTRWIIDTLAFQSQIDRRSPDYEYLDMLRDQFFPMVKFPNDASTFILPSVEEVKKILYKNGIGYKTVDRKLLIPRFYKLPSLLFPNQTWTIKVLHERNNLDLLMNNKEVLIADMKRAGFDEANRKEISKKLDEYVEKFHYSSRLPQYSGKSSLKIASSLDALMRSDDKISLTPSTPVTLPVNIESDKLELYNEEEVDGDDESTTAVYFRDWNEQLNEKYGTTPQNRLEIDRDQYYASLVFTNDYTYEDNLEFELEQLKTAKLQTSVIMAARLTNEYEAKESARRSRDWDRRGVLERSESDLRLRLK